MKAFILGGALAAMTLVSGCAMTSGVLTPSASTQSDIDTAFTAICGSSGLLAAAAPFAASTQVSTYYSEAQTLCANGEPTNAIVAGIDVFDLYLDLSTALSKKSAMKKAMVLKAKHA